MAPTLAEEKSGGLPKECTFEERSWQLRFGARFLSRYLLYEAIGKGTPSCR